MKTEHILVIRFSAMGDVAMTVPVIQSLAKQYPKVRITVLSRPFARPFFEDLAPNVGFMEADIKEEYKGVKGLNALYRRLIAKQFTAIADLHSVLRSDYLRMRFNLDNFKVAHIDKHRKGKRKLVASNGKNLCSNLHRSKTMLMFCTTWISYPHGFHIYLWGWKTRRFKYLTTGGVRSRRERYLTRRQAHNRAVDWYCSFAAHEEKYIRYN